MKTEIRKHLLELLSKEEIEMEWWEKYLDLLFEFRKELIEESAESTALDPEDSSEESSPADTGTKDAVLSELTASFDEMNQKIIESNNKVLEAIKESLPETYTLPNEATASFLKSQNQQKEE
ncbi:hypothetical protein [Bacillus swezeyi]|uniref:hypothetical protein n=1 Tax=Bacillus swezeyi TaxID=1925020 RepID=UPI003F8C6E8E